VKHDAVGRKVLGQRPPGATLPDQIKDGVDDFPSGVLGWAPSRFGLWDQVGEALPLGIGEVGGVSFSVHTSIHRPNSVFGQALSAVPDRLHPILEGRLRSLATQGKLNPVWGVPGSHSEVWALNQAVMRREAPGLGVQSLDDFAMYNVSLWRSRLGKPVPRCGNCQILTDGVRVLSGG
jgi:hypothetical protein